MEWKASYQLPGYHVLCYTCVLLYRITGILICHTRLDALPSTAATSAHGCRSAASRFDRVVVSTFGVLVNAQFCRVFVSIIAGTGYSRVLTPATY